MNGFLGTSATLEADLNLTIQLSMGMGIALLAGMMLARPGHYRAHGICQGSIMLLNLAMILFIMLPSFRRSVVHKFHSENPEPIERSKLAKQKGRQRIQR